VARIAMRFINAPIDALDTRFAEVLAEVASFADVDVGRVLRFEDNSTCVNTHIGWPEVAIPASRSRFDLATYPWWLARLRAGESVVFDAETPVPDTAVNENAAFNLLGIRAAISAPVRCEGELWGFVELKVHRPGYRWRPSVIAGLRLVCEVLGSALQRRTREQAYQNQVRFLNALTQSLPSTVFIYDRHARKTLYLNRNMLLDFGYDQAFLDQHDIDALGARLTHPDDLHTLAAQDARVDELPEGVAMDSEYRMRDAQGGLVHKPGNQRGCG